MPPVAHSKQWLPNSSDFHCGAAAFVYVVVVVAADIVTLPCVLPPIFPRRANTIAPYVCLSSSLVYSLYISAQIPLLSPLPPVFSFPTGLRF